jgi:hypothetical protein
MSTAASLSADDENGDEEDRTNNKGASWSDDDDEAAVRSLADEVVTGVEVEESSLIEAAGEILRGTVIF